jgi:hypothetical protein
VRDDDLHPREDLEGRELLEAPAKENNMRFLIQWCLKQQCPLGAGVQDCHAPGRSGSLEGTPNLTLNFKRKKRQ